MMKRSDKEMKKVKLYLKSGQMVEFIANDFTLSRNGLGEVTQASWSNVKDKTTLMFADLDEINAVTYEEIQS
jgi:hypothetical protein